ncbi:MAG: hypothetical protein ACJA11_000478 [Glaciecola sp.]|jgi:hypothetical protein
MAKKMDAKEIESIDVEGLGLVQKGMKVEHPMFGLGVVESIFEFIKSGENTIRINFEKYGSKALVPEYAKLTLPKVTMPPQKKQSPFLANSLNGGRDA